MIVKNGTEHKNKNTDEPKKCAGCGRLFYVDRNWNGVWVKCPHCGRKH